MIAFISSESFPVLVHSLASSPTVERFGRTLVHSVWEGALIGLLLPAVLVSTRSRRGATWSNFRYLTSLAALCAIVVAAGVTFARVSVTARTQMENIRASHNAMPAQAAAPLIPADVSTTPIDHSFDWQILLPWSVSIWTAGVFMLSLWQLLGWIQVQRLRRGGELVDSNWMVSLQSASARLKLRRAVRLVQSARVNVPVVIGVLRPVIIVPAAVLSGISIGQMEALLAHELAHVRRHDYLINLVQSGVETIFFYHPCVWWISAQIRREREHCCDDLAAETCGAVVYARALVAVEERRSKRGSVFALSAADGALSARIRRVLASPARRSRSHSLLVVAAALMCVALPIGWERLRVAQAETAPTTAASESPLDKIMPELKFDRVSLLDVIDFLRDASGANISVNWRAVEAAGIDKNTPVTANLHNVKLGKALRIILDDAGGTVKLAMTFDEGVISIATDEIAAKMPAQGTATLATRPIDVDNPIANAPGQRLAEAKAFIPDPSMSETDQLQAMGARIRMAAITERLFSLDSGMKSMLRVYGPDNPNVRSMQAEHDELQSVLNEEMQEARQRDARRAGENRAKSGEYYVTGDIARVGVYSLSKQPITVKQAVVSAGWIRGATGPYHRITVIRRNDDGTESNLMDGVTLESLFDGKRKDFQIRSGDIISVGEGQVGDPNADTTRPAQP